MSTNFITSLSLVYIYKFVGISFTLILQLHYNYIYIYILRQVTRIQFNRLVELILCILEVLGSNLGTFILLGFWVFSSTSGRIGKYWILIHGNDN
jgi:hypothetical protein